MAESLPEWLPWAMVVLSWVSFGSFAVPIKLKSTKTVHPLVFQSYKSFWVLLSAPVVLLWGTAPILTPWGLLSGLFWVPAGVAAVYAVQHAGLAVAQGTWSALIVAVSFAEGLCLGNGVSSLPLALTGCLLIAAGTTAMAVVSAPGKTARGEDDVVEGEDGRGGEEEERRKLLDAMPPRDDVDKTASLAAPASRWTDKQRGLAAAVFNGVYGGSIMLPMTLMKRSGTNVVGIAFVLSFALGAAAVTVLLWLGLFLHHAVAARSVAGGVRALPPLQLRTMAVPGAAAGLLWATGNVASTYAVIGLGQAVGYSAVQAAIFVSGLWGIAVFREVRGGRRIGAFFLAAAVAMGGIVLVAVTRKKE